MKFFQKYSRKSMSADKIADVTSHGDLKHQYDIANGNSPVATSSLEVLNSNGVARTTVRQNGSHVQPSRRLATYANGEVKAMPRGDDDVIMESADQLLQSSGDGSVKQKKRSRHFSLPRMRSAGAPKSSKSRDMFMAVLIDDVIIVCDDSSCCAALVCV